jgi:hypothetical protein
MGANATTGVELFTSNGTIFASGANSGLAGLGACATGDVIGLAIDLDNRKAWFRKAPSGNWNGLAIGSQNPATNTGGIAIPPGSVTPICTFGGSGGVAGNVFTGNFGASAFVGAVPSGFTSGWTIKPPSVSAFAAFDPATVTAVTLSGSSLIATNTGTTSADQGAHVAASAGKTSGKYYFEITWTTITGSSADNRGVGVGTTASTYTGMGNGGTTGVINYRTGSTWSNGASILAGAGNWLTGQIIGFAVDLDNRRFWFRLTPAGNWNNNVANNPATNTGGLVIPAGTMVPFVTFGGTSGVANNVVTANFGATAFSGAVPSGFTSGWPA